MKVQWEMLWLAFSLTNPARGTKYVVAISMLQRSDSVTWTQSRLLKNCRRSRTRTATTFGNQPGKSPKLGLTRIVGPVKLQFKRQRARKAVQIGKQRGLRDIHPIEFAHPLFTKLFRRQQELDHCVLRVWILLENLLDRLVQNTRQQKST